MVCESKRILKGSNQQASEIHVAELLGHDRHALVERRALVPSLSSFTMRAALQNLKIAMYYPNQNGYSIGKEFKTTETERKAELSVPRAKD